MSRPRYYIHLYASIDSARSGWGVFDADANEFVRVRQSIYKDDVVLFREATDALSFCRYLISKDESDK